MLCIYIYAAARRTVETPPYQGRQMNMWILVFFEVLAIRIEAILVCGSASVRGRPAAGDLLHLVDGDQLADTWCRM